ncbi:amidohydrolase [Coriobacterium glomerans PW2]|uniref:Amidohydrolase n=1 Tax=Coriobacterium glomerans (strain ATCC 49209 / DSM 20642 / JCM 10262 / PW2) TaxID=700015 RepID=F2N8F6_CORGP|nr:amidohydrolase [Coriobacterium glomerans]AEB07339.1 amidohydrolase [Coriobacterium glomerans PW2]
MDVMGIAEDSWDHVVELRRQFHRHPETGWREQGTQRLIEQELDVLGIPYVEVAGTGVIATLVGKRGLPVIGLRADMDALPVKEETGLPFASEYENTSHACGHDAHMAMLLTAAKILSEHRDELKGTVRFIFQPAEELGGGAKRVAALPEVQDIDTFMAIHIWSPIPVGKISVQAGPRMSACDVFRLTIRGDGGHAASPETAIDPIPCAAAVISALQTIVSREISSTEAAVVSVCTLRAGTGFNVIPDEVTLTGTVRSFSHGVHAQIPQAMERIIGGTCDAFRTTFELDYTEATPPVINDEDCSRRAEAAVRATAGDEALIDYPMIGVAEDFSFFTRDKPGVLALVGGGKLEGPVYPHHHAKFDIDERGLVMGVALFVQYVLETQEEMRSTARLG